MSERFDISYHYENQAKNHFMNPYVDNNYVNSNPHFYNNNQLHVSNKNNNNRNVSSSNKNLNVINLNNNLPHTNILASNTSTNFSKNTILNKNSSNYINNNLNIKKPSHISTTIIDDIIKITPVNLIGKMEENRRPLSTVPKKKRKRKNKKNIKIIAKNKKKLRNKLKNMDKKFELYKPINSSENKSKQNHDQRNNNKKFTNSVPKYTNNLMAFKLPKIKENIDKHSSKAKKNDNSNYEYFRQSTKNFGNNNNNGNIMSNSSNYFYCNKNNNGDKEYLINNGYSYEFAQNFFNNYSHSNGVGSNNLGNNINNHNQQGYFRQNYHKETTYNNLNNNLVNNNLNQPSKMSSEKVNNSNTINYGNSTKQIKHSKSTSISDVSPMNKLHNSVNFENGLYKSVNIKTINKAAFDDAGIVNSNNNNNLSTIKEKANNARSMPKSLVQKKQENLERFIRVRKSYQEGGIKQSVQNLKSFVYNIVPGNASYLIKYCMQHRTSWKEPFLQVSSFFNFKWQQISYGLDYNALNKHNSIKQVVNHFENHFVISNKANMFINLMKYCESRKVSVFKYVPFTIVFKIKALRRIKDPIKQKEFDKNIEEQEENLKLFINIYEKYIKQYDDLGNYYFDESYLNDRKLREERENNDGIKKGKKNSFNSKFDLYSDFFPKLKVVDRIPNVKCNVAGPYAGEKEIKEEKKKTKMIGSNSLIEIPQTHYLGKNLWVVKAINLNRGQCIKVVNSYDQIKKVVDKFKEGVDYGFTEEKLEETQQEDEDDEEINNNDNSNCNKITNANNNSIVHNEKLLCDKHLTEHKISQKVVEEESKKKEEDKDNTKEKDKKLYVCNRLIIQKYIEDPLLYKGRKCDMRIWVLLTHTMKVYVFKEGHLKTCSVKFDINSKDAFTHITNYSFQKYNDNFQKFEKGNEVPFYEFQNFIDENYSQKNYKLSQDLMKQIKEIVRVTMRCGKDKINKNQRSNQFEIFGYDFMLDSQFNVYLIEINTNPGLEESSPWIKIIVPRMLDDALRLTLDLIFDPVYDFTKIFKDDKHEENYNNVLNEYNNYINKKKSKDKEEQDYNKTIDNNLDSTIKNSKSSITEKTEEKLNNINGDKNLEIKTEQKKDDSSIAKLSRDLLLLKTTPKTTKDINLNNEINEIKKVVNSENLSPKHNTNIKDNNTNIFIKKEELNKSKTLNATIENDTKFNESLTERKKDSKDINISGKYKTPFPVPGYKDDENLWDFVVDLNERDPLDDFLEKPKDNQNNGKNFTGIKHLLNKKKNIPSSNAKNDKRNEQKELKNERESNNNTLKRVKEKSTNNNKEEVCKNALESDIDSKTEPKNIDKTHLILMNSINDINKKDLFVEFNNEKTKNNDNHNTNTNISEIQK